MRRTGLAFFLASLLCSNALYGGNNFSETHIMFKDKKVIAFKHHDTYEEDTVCVKLTSYSNGISYHDCFAQSVGRCGLGTFGDRPKGYDKRFCDSPFTELKSIKDEAIYKLGTGIGSLGLMPIWEGTMHTKAVNIQLVYDYIEDTDIKEFEPLIKLGIVGNAVVLRNFNLDDYFDGKESFKLVNKLPNDNLIIFDKISNHWIYVDRDLTPNQLIANWVKDIMKPREPDPVYVPAMITDPYVPPVVELAKDEFETKAQYKARLDQAIKDREKIILDNQKQHAKLIEERNKEVYRLRGVYKKEIAVINKEQDEKQKKLAPQIEQYAKLAFFMTRKQISLTNPMYDAETGIMEVNVSVKPSYESKLITFKQNADEARNFKNNLYAVESEAEYEVKNNTFRLKKIISKYDGKTHVYEAPIADFPPEKVSLEMNKEEGFKIVFTPEQEATMFALQENTFVQKKKITAATSIKKKSSAN